MAAEGFPLIEQLYAFDRSLASYAFVIGQTSRERLKGSENHDFVHCEAVLSRLSQILPDARQFGLNSTEIFVLVASAYLHDIGRAKAMPGGTHGNLSADMIAKDETLRVLFPSNDLRSQVERICDYHDRKKISEIRELYENVLLDVRPQSHIKPGERVRLRVLAAIFRLADELECISDRMRGVPRKDNDARIYISAIRIYLEARSIFIDFSRDSSQKGRKSCIQHLTDVLAKLDEFLKPYELSFKLVDKSPEVTKEPEEEEEEQDILKGEDRVDLEEEQETVPSYRKAGVFKVILRNLEENRMKRLHSVILQSSKKGGDVDDSRDLTGR